MKKTVKMEYEFTGHVEDWYKPADNTFKKFKALTKDRTMIYKFEASEEEAEMLMKWNGTDIEDAPKDVRIEFGLIWHRAGNLLLRTEGLYGAEVPSDSYPYVVGNEKGTFRIKAKKNAA